MVLMKKEAESKSRFDDTSPQGEDTSHTSQDIITQHGLKRCGKLTKLGEQVKMLKDYIDAHSHDASGRVVVPGKDFVKIE